MTGDHLMAKALADHRAGRLEQAKEEYVEILRTNPRHADALHMLGMVAGQTGNYAPAVELIQQSLAIKSDSPEAYNNLGNALRELGKVDEAAAAYLRAVELRPNFPGVFRNLGNVYNDQGQPERAIECYRKALALDPKSAELHSHLLYSLQFHPAYDARALLVEHRAWADRHAKPLAAEIKPHGNSRLPDRKLRIGYVSPDFCNHPVGRLLKPLFANHDHTKFEIICYSDVPAPDVTTGDLRAKTDAWYNAYGTSHEQLARNIRKNGIDVLIDLTQHSGANRLLTFARKPAPVQAAWLGYPGTTGLATMDYRLTDPYLDPPGETDGDYTEKSLRLPHCFWCYQPPDGQNEAVAPPPFKATGVVTFGSMNRFAKVTAPTLSLWRRILQAVPQSRLRLHSKIGAHLEPVREFFSQGGVDPSRLSFIERKPVAEYLREYGQIDICLDAIPHGGGTTTCDAVWMGVPVVSLRGKTAVGRGGASILANIGLTDLIAADEQAYVDVAVKLAHAPNRLVELRNTLRLRLSQSPLMNASQFADDMESAYRQMWREWCKQGK